MGRLALRWAMVLLAAAAAWLVRARAAETAAPGAYAGDEAIYWRLGTHWAEFGVLAYEAAVPSAFRSPLYPAFVAWTRGPAGRASARRVLRAQAWLGAAGALILYLAGCLLGAEPARPGAPEPAARGRLAGLSAAWIWALHPALAAGSSVLRSESLDALLTAASAFFLIRFARKPGPGRAAAWGLSLGAALTARSVLVLAPWAALAAGAFVPRRVPGVRRWALPLLVGAYLPLAPWIARNALHFREPVPLERHPAALALHHAALGNTGADGIAEYARAAVERRPELAQVDTVEFHRRVWRLALREILAHPLRYARGCARRAAFLWSHHALLACLALGALILNRERVECWALAGLGAYFTINAAFDPYAIRMLPALGPLALLAGSAALAWRRPLGSLDGPRGWAPAAAFPAALSALLYLLPQAGLARETWRLLPEALTRPADLPEPKVYLDRAVLLARDGRRAVALRLLDRGAFHYPRYAALHLTHGALLLESGRRREAALAYGRALAILEGHTAVDDSLAHAREGLAAAQGR